jgi:hypothetical protein
MVAVKKGLCYYFNDVLNGISVNYDEVLFFSDEMIVFVDESFRQKGWWREA